MKTILSIILTSFSFLPASQAAVASEQQAGSAFPVWTAVLISSLLIFSIIGLVLALSSRRKRRARRRVASPPPPRPARRRRRRSRVIVIR